MYIPPPATYINTIHACGIIFNLLHFITMHFIYQINRLTTTKADSTYLDTIPCHTIPYHAIPCHICHAIPMIPYHTLVYFYQRMLCVKNIMYMIVIS